MIPKPVSLVIADSLFFLPPNRYSSSAVNMITVEIQDFTRSAAISWIHLTWITRTITSPSTCTTPTKKVNLARIVPPTTIVVTRVSVRIEFSVLRHPTLMRVGAELMAIQKSIQCMMGRCVPANSIMSTSINVTMATIVRLCPTNANTHLSNTIVLSGVRSASIRRSLSMTPSNP